MFDIIGDATYRQTLTQSTSIDTTTTVNTGVYDHVLTEHRDWPLSVAYGFFVVADGSAAQVTTIDQGLNRSIDVDCVSVCRYVASPMISNTCEFENAIVCCTVVVMRPSDVST